MFTPPHVPRAGFAAAAWLLAVSTAPPSLAQSKKTGPSAVAPDAEKGLAVPFTLTPALREALRSEDVNAIRAALDEVRLAGPRAAAAAPLLSELLGRGVDGPTTEAALDTYADLEVEASPVVSWYTRHRTLTIRRAAVKALVRSKGAAAVRALRLALTDDDPMVRGLAATGLGSLRAKEAINDLFAALDHKVHEAAASIGQICESAQCTMLLGKLGRLPFDVVTSGLDPVLFRREVADEDKLKIVDRVRELGTAEANRYLKDLAKRWPASGSNKVKQAIEQAILATSGSAS